VAPSPPPGPDLWLGDRPVSVLVRGRSMEPFLRDGDRVEAVAVSPGGLRPGDLVVFEKGGEATVHRLLAVRGGLFLEKGDGQGTGSWLPWPKTVGRVVALWREGRRVDLLAPPWPRRMAFLGRLHRWRHAAGTLSSRLPGTLLPRLAPGLLRRLPLPRWAEGRDPW